MVESSYTSEVVQRHALLISREPELFRQMSEALLPLYSLLMEPSPPQLWPDDLELVLIDANSNDEEILELVRDCASLSRGLAPFLLLRDRDAELMLKATRAGAQGFIELPHELPHALSVIHMEERRRRGKGGMVSAFFSLKGGVGCTSLAVNTAHHLSQMTVGRTVVVDMNMPLGDIAFYLNVQEDMLYSISDFVRNLERFDEKLIFDSLCRHDSGIYLLGLPSNFEELEHLTAASVRAALNTLRQYFDHVVIDGSSDLNPVMLSCLDDADTIVLVTEPSLSSLRAAQAVYELGQRLGYPEEKLRLVLNRHTAVGENIVDLVLAAMELPVSARITNDYQHFLESMNDGVLLHSYTPDTEPDRQIRALAQMLHHGSPTIAESPEPDSAQQASAGVLGRLQRLWPWPRRH